MAKDTTPRPRGSRRELVSIQEVADHLGVAVITVRRLISNGQLKAYRVGHAIRLDIAEVDASLEVIPTVGTEGGEH